MTSFDLPNWQKEIIELHQFFEDWLNGRLPATSQSLSRFAEVLHPHFHIVTPHGKTISRNQLLTGFYEAHGSQNNIKILIKSPQILLEADAFTLATYEEHQSTSENATQRISSVLFQQAPEPPNQLLWIHVHETWVTP